MEKLQKLLGDCLNSGLVRIIISNCRKPGMAAKVVVKPFEDKGTLFSSLPSIGINRYFIPIWNKVGRDCI